MSRSQKPSRQVPVDEQIQVVLAVLRGELSVAEAARRHGVSSATVGNWRDRFVDLDDLRIDRGQMDVVDADDFVIGEAPAPIAVVTDNGPCFRGVVFADAFTGDDPLLRHVRTWVKSPQTNGVVERFFGTLKYEHLYRAIIGDGGALAVEVNCFRHTYNTLRPHQALRDHTTPRLSRPCDDFRAARQSIHEHDHRQLPSGRARQPTHQASPTSGLPTTEEHDMSKVKADISMSLDGYIDAAGVSMEEGIGRGGEVLHEWGHGDDVDELGARAGERAHDVGALICGRRTYDLSVQFWEANGPTGPEQRVPVFVLTHSVPDRIPENGVYQFVQGEPAEVLAKARDAAGDGGVSIMGGAHAIQQFLSAGLVDEIHIHLVPVLFGAGTRLFELDLPSHIRLEQDRVDVSPTAIHLVYRVRQ